MIDRLSEFREIWFVDYEFTQPDGDHPTVICMVAREFRSGRTLRLWADELYGSQSPPFSLGPDALYVAYLASAEMSCHIALGWEMPTMVLDLFTEFRCLTNGLGTVAGNGLLGAMTHFGLPSIESAEKDAMRDLAIRGGPYTPREQQALLDYCESDVVALSKLLPKMVPTIDLPRALLRGRYMKAVARMEWCGVPIDTETLSQIREHWEPIKGRLIEAVDRDFGVYAPSDIASVNVKSRAVQEVFGVADEHGINRYDLLAACREVRSHVDGMTRDFRRSLDRVRKITGLTTSRISRWENSGYDHATYPGLDVQARELAAEYPELGLGTGFQHGTNYDDTDYAAKLWELMRDTTVREARITDPEVLDEALRLVDSDARYRQGRMTFSAKLFADWLSHNDIPWPRLDSGVLALDDETFRQMAKAYPKVAPLRELRLSLSTLKLESLAVGPDGRNRLMLSVFGSRSGRNQPSNSRFIFGPSCWIRGLIKPAMGRAVAYVDWSQQEFGIGAALSGDAAMKEAYASGDPYLAFAKQAGAVPDDATKESHPRERALFKTCALGVQYGLGAESLARSLDAPPIVGHQLLDAHKRTYRDFWRWTEGAINHAMWHGWLQTVFGWRVHVGSDPNSRSLANFPCQGNGAEMMRLACILATERGVDVCCPIHDALLVEGPLDAIQSTVEATQRVMAEASRIVLKGFELRSDAEVVCYPDRYMDERGERMWETITKILTELEVELCVSSDLDF